MSVFQFLELQPIEPQDDGSISELDQYEHDELIDLYYEPDGEELIRTWSRMEGELHTNEESN